jgi:hypothetical protein
MLCNDGSFAFSILSATATRYDDPLSIGFRSAEDPFAGAEDIYFGPMNEFSAPVFVTVLGTRL